MFLNIKRTKAHIAFALSAFRKNITSAAKIVTFNCRSDILVFVSIAFYIVIRNQTLK